MSDHLPREVIEDILSRVPVKSLLRFRCVRKSWRSLIDSPKFFKASLKHSQKQKLLLLRYFTQTTRRDENIICVNNATFDEHANIICPIKSQSLYYRVVGTCNGLICLVDDQPTSSVVNRSHTVILWNPAILKMLELPMPSIDLSMAALGFGFDSQTNDFKVVRLACKRVVGVATAPMVEVYSVASGSWKTIPNGWDPSYGIVQDLWSQVFLNGSVHWLGYKSVDRSRRDGTVATTPIDDADKYFWLQGYRATPEDGFHNVVLALDLAKEEFRVIELPESVADRFPLNFSLGLHKDSLALFAYDNRLNCKMFYAVAMKEYGVVESWSNLLQVKSKETICTVFGFTDVGDILYATASNLLRAYSGKGYATFGNPGLKGSLYAGSFEESLGLLNEGQRISYKVAAASEDDVDDVSKLDLEFIQTRMNQHYLSIAAAIIGILPHL